MMSSRLLPGVRTARWLALIVGVGLLSLGSGCMTSTPTSGSPEEGAAPEAEAEGQPAGVVTAEEAGSEPGRPDPAVAEVGAAGTAMTTGSAVGAAISGDIGPGTRRTSRGLPDSLAAYASWFVLRPAPGQVVPDGIFAGQRLYVRSRRGGDPVCAGDTLAGQLGPGTTVVLESKQADDDFVRQLDSVERTESGWVFSTFRRERATEGFEKVAADPAAGRGCPGCQRLAEAIDATPQGWIFADE